MTGYFQWQLAYYANAHRDHVNSVMHIIGNPLLFMAVVLPLCLLPVSVFGFQTTAAPGYPGADAVDRVRRRYGSGLVVIAILLLFVAAAIVGRVSVLRGLDHCGWTICYRLRYANPRTLGFRAQTANAVSTMRVRC